MSILKFNNIFNLQDNINCSREIRQRLKLTDADTIQCTDLFQRDGDQIAVRESVNNFYVYKEIEYNPDKDDDDDIILKIQNFINDNNNDNKNKFMNKINYTFHVATKEEKAKGDPNYIGWYETDVHFYNRTFFKKRRGRYNDAIKDILENCLPIAIIPRPFKWDIFINQRNTPSVTKFIEGIKEELLTAKKGLQDKKKQSYKQLHTINGERNIDTLIKPDKTEYSKRIPGDNQEIQKPYENTIFLERKNNNYLDLQDLQDLQRYLRKCILEIE